MKQFILFMCAAILLLSCSKKKDTPTVTNPTTNDTTTQADASKLSAGDWHGVSAYNLYYDASGNLTSADGGSKYYSHNGMYWADSMEEKFTFHADGTYDHVRVDGQTGWDFFSIFIPVHGTWQLKNDSHTFAITYSGGVSGNGQQDFKVEAFTDHYLHVTYTDSLHPQKDVYHMEFTK